MTTLYYACVNCQHSKHSPSDPDDDRFLECYHPSLMGHDRVTGKTEPIHCGHLIYINKCDPKKHFSSKPVVTSDIAKILAGQCIAGLN